MARKYEAEWAAVEAAEAAKASGVSVIAAAEAECSADSKKAVWGSDDRRPDRAEILDAAKACVCGDRDRQYGSPEDNFHAIAKAWEWYFAARGRGGLKIDAVDVAHMMCLFKIARATTGVGTRDSYVDLCGYAACAGEIAGKNGA